DVVTGLPRRDAMQRFVKSEVARAQRYGFSIGLALLRINDLEQIHANYGKQATDNVLQIYGSNVLSRLRSYDVAVRYGVDQFAIL
ncbi:MAG: diguanylate cyclase, partial [Gammaproteobacteria bacterium]|nr:diguanylate cyclase [Gammaproteobacteria bacterium]NIR95668.1 diguanylate cyclase [Gammaproteobacteria bacterium]